MGTEMISDDAFLLMVMLGMTCGVFAIGGGIVELIIAIQRKRVSKRRAKLRGAIPNKRR